MLMWALYAELWGRLERVKQAYVFNLTGHSAITHEPCSLSTLLSPPGSRLGMNWEVVPPRSTSPSLWNYWDVELYSSTHRDSTIRIEQTSRFLRK